MRGLAKFGVVGAMLACASSAPPRSVSFVGCPIAQDVAPDRDLCFYAEYRGQRYGLVNPNDFGQPELGHKVLVEAVESGGPLQCGGIALEGRISVLQELSPECNQIMPATGVAPPALTPERQRALDEELAAISESPNRSLRSIPLASAPPQIVVPGRVVEIYYPFDSDRSSGPDAQRMVEAAHFARDRRGSRISIKSYQGTSKLDDGTLLSERASMAQQRADKVRTILTGLGAPADAIDVAVITTAERPTGYEDWKQRRIEMTVIGGRK